MSISLAAAVTAMSLVSLSEDQQPHLFRMDPTGVMAAEAQPAQERFELERNAEIDASIAVVAARRAQERFEQERNVEIDASIATKIIPWVVSIAGRIFAGGDGPKQPW